jgi:phenylacetate-coenzyme A ligase PaaK-like adenylate-forming protein
LAGISIVKNIFQKDAGFEANAAAVFQFQYQQNPVYRQWCDFLKINSTDYTGIQNIPFLPISFFKSHKVYADSNEPAVIFTSSGTTGTINSQHFVKDIDTYETSFLNGFEHFYGKAEDICFLGLLPGYMERSGSSLVYMVNELIKRSKHKYSGTYLHDHEKLAAVLKKTEAEKIPTILIGVTYALLDFAEHFPMKLHSTIIMETGGMKGKRAEITRGEVHEILKNAFKLSAVHSEYGMTELLSQAYSKGNGIFECPPWMKVLVRDETDPLSMHITGRGALNIIDLANVYSTSFIATDDLGIVYEDGSFEVLGRMDNSDIRGCSLLTL